MAALLKCGQAIATKSVLKQFPPMGVYETLFAFQAATGKYMGNEGTHPWAQGFPLTTPVPGGPTLPTSVSFTHADLKYPPATGGAELLNAVRDYYNHFYKSKVTTDNIAIFAGGRPAIYAALSFLQPDVRVLVEETEYTPYWDVLELLGKDYRVIPSNEKNHFSPSLVQYRAAGAVGREAGKRCVVLKSNPCNPTGMVWSGKQLEGLVDFCSAPDTGGVIDEAYEFFQNPEADSAMRYIKDIDSTNMFVVSAATKGLQAPGLRVGWVVASKQNIEIFRNFSSLAMGGISRPSQILVADMLQTERVAQSRTAIAAFYGSQRERYGAALRELGCQLFTGDGGFYHWLKLPHGLTAEEFNIRLFRHNAGILPGPLVDMLRRGSLGPHGKFVRFSFGPLPAESFEGDVAILRACLKR